MESVEEQTKSSVPTKVCLGIVGAPKLMDFFLQDCDKTLFFHIDPLDGGTPVLVPITVRADSVQERENKLFFRGSMGGLEPREASGWVTPGGKEYVCGLLEITTAQAS